ncbi:Trypsin family protein [Brugia pahangi]
MVAAREVGSHQKEISVINFITSSICKFTTSGRSHNLDNLIDNGRVITQRRVVGGNESTPHVWPWTVQLIYAETKIHRCGAALLSDDIIITAAHCFSRRFTFNSSIKKFCGLEIGSEKAIGFVIFQYIHYLTFLCQVHLMLHRLHGKLNFSENVLPICLPMLEPSTADSCIVTGWGYQEESGSFSSKLRETHVPIIPIVVCNSILHYFGRVDPLSMICAGSGGADACQGDSGGPLMCYSRIRQRWELQEWSVGVTDVVETIFLECMLKLGLSLVG